MHRFFATVADEEYEVVIDDSGVVQVNGQTVPFDLVKTSACVYAMRIEGRSMRLAAHADGPHCTFIVDGQLLHVTVESFRDRLLSKQTSGPGGSSGTLEVRAPMPALVVAVSVSPGDVVKPGDGLVILEAMKMENEIRSHGGGTITEVLVDRGEPVEKGQLLLRLK